VKTLVQPVTVLHHPLDVLRRFFEIVQLGFELCDHYGEFGVAGHLFLCQYKRLIASERIVGADGQDGPQHRYSDQTGENSLWIAFEGIAAGKKLDEVAENITNAEEEDKGGQVVYQTPDTESLETDSVGNIIYDRRRVNHHHLAETDGVEGHLDSAAAGENRKTGEDGGC